MSVARSLPRSARLDVSGERGCGGHQRVHCSTSSCASHLLRADALMFTSSAGYTSIHAMLQAVGMICWSSDSVWPSRTK